MQNKPTLLLVGGGTRVSHIEHFREQFTVYTTDTDRLAPANKAADRFFITRPFNHTGFAYDMIHLLAAENVDVVVPASHHAVAALDLIREEIGRSGAMLLLCNSDSVRICLDKESTMKAFEELRLAVAK